MSALAETTWESFIESRRRVNRGERPWKPKPYAPNLRPDQLKALYYLKELERRPMTKLLQEAFDHYLERHGGVEALIERGRAEVGEQGERVCRRCADR